MILHPVHFYIMKTYMLKTLTLILLTSAYYFNAMAQTKEEQEIGKLEQQESHAVLTGDLPGLLNTYWSPKLIVNNPANIVVTRPQIIELIKSACDARDAPASILIPRACWMRVMDVGSATRSDAFRRRDASRWK